MDASPSVVAEVLPTTTTVTTLEAAVSPMPEAVIARGTLVDVNDPDLRAPCCRLCPVPATPLIAEHPDVVPRLRGKTFLVLNILVDEEGKVSDVKPLRDVEILTQAAVKAVRKWRLDPGQIKGVAVKVWLGVPFRFRLPDDPPERDESRAAALTPRPCGA
jgi:TonB family protein